MACAAGFEPATYGLEDRCSNPTELRRVITTIRTVSLFAFGGCVQFSHLISSVVYCPTIDYREQIPLPELCHILKHYLRRSS